MSKYLDLSVKEINGLLKDKIIRPIDLVNECFERIENNKELNAFITLNKEDAIKEALALENLEVDNLFFGIPIAIKDNIMTNNLRTTAASKMLENFIPIYDATVVKKLKEKHLIIIGKTNMDEFAMGSSNQTSYFGPVKNAWNHAFIPGGSSGGSAVSVSSHMTPLALGTDTGGSIRQPAAFCGLVGLKPTYGRVSRYGLIAFASSLDQIGPMTRNVYENAALLNIICGKDKNDLTSYDAQEEDFTRYINKPLKNIKIAIPNFYVNKFVDKEIIQSFDKVVSILKDEGIEISYIDIDYLENAVSLYQVIALGEASSNLARFDGIRYGYSYENPKDLEELYLNTRKNGFGKEVKRRIMIGSYLLSGKNAQEYYFKAMKIRDDMKKSFEEKFKTYDFIIGPTTTGLPSKLGEKETNATKSFLDDAFTNPVNMAGLPGISIPIGFSENSLPIGMQIIGNKMEEAKMYQLAAFLENKLNLDLTVKEEAK